MTVKYTVYTTIEAYDSAKENTAEDDCWHPSDEIDLAEFDNLEEAEQFMQALGEAEQHRWIPVSEEMPEQVSGHWGSEIVFATDGKQAWVCKYNFSAEYWTAPSGDITHWKPIILP